MKRVWKVIPVIEKSLLLVGNSQKVPLEDKQRSNWHFNRLIQGKILIESNYLIIKHCEISIVAPYQVSSAAWYDCFERSCLDNTELSSIAQSEVMTIGTMSQVGWVHLSCSELFRWKRDFLSVFKRLIVDCFKISWKNFHWLSINKFSIADTDNRIIRSNFNKDRSLIKA